MLFGTHDMKTIIRTAIVMLTLATATAANAACNHSTSAPWASAKKHGLVLEAHSVGSLCGKTALVLAIADGKGEVLWSTTRLAQHVSIFAGEDVVTDKAVKAALKDWIENGKDSGDHNTGTLPDWPKGAEAPKREGEFGYFAQQDMSREDYLEKRKQALPMFCFVQGMESISCIITSDGRYIEEFGGFTFPG
jgi:hypothetical protein